MIIEEIEVKESRACSGAYTTKVWFHSITSEFFLYCGNSYSTESLETVIFFVSSILLIIFMLLQNKFGSKNIIVSSFCLLALPGFICLTLVDNLELKTVGFSFLWAFVDILTSVSMIYSNELLVNPLRNISNIIYQMNYYIGGLITTFLSSYITHYKYLSLTYFVGYSICILIVAFFVPRSPSYLLKQKKNDELKTILAKISKVNNLPPEDFEMVQINLNSIFQCKNYLIIR